ncbi:glycosyltransferase [Prolixibacter sp. SD074]|uniref:glycosyltransferase n=1 Tax=Prolixibacter sp. SD074 TaxID=2652391 RepID=UPI001299089D|nr:glycosyltransferase [Prolixibacter sp. SD074]
MKILFLADANSIHTKRWVTSLAEKDVEILLFSFEKNSDKEQYKHNNIQIVDNNYKNSKKGPGQTSKLRIISYLPKLKRTIKSFKPDIVHAHYASSYGLLGALTGFQPLITSVWGSDVYIFPKISILHRKLLKFNLNNAKVILSTSHSMANETKKYINKDIEITPFGVDVNRFKKLPNVERDELIIGNVKSLAPIYGIDILIRSFNQILKKNPTQNLRLQIIGEGPEKENLQTLARSLNIEEYVDFLGKIDNSELPLYYNKFALTVSPSISESFGVVAIEAMACECPVVVSDADGFSEVVKDTETGYIAPKKDIEATADAIQKLLDDSTLRARMGKKGRERVLQLYNWEENVDNMINIYKKTLLLKK